MWVALGAGRANANWVVKRALAPIVSQLIRQIEPRVLILGTPGLLLYDPSVREPGLPNPAPQ